MNIETSLSRWKGGRKGRVMLGELLVQFVHALAGKIVRFLLGKKLVQTSNYAL